MTARKEYAATEQLETIHKVYEAEPTVARFHNDRDSVVRYIKGPFGSGKSTGCIMELLMQGMKQQPDAQGIRRTRYAIVRGTYPELKTTTIKTFEHWVPNSIAPVVYSIPYNATFEQPLEDGTRVRIEFIFIAMETPEDTKKLLSFELTGAYVNEARELPKELIDNLMGRIGRYPETVKDKDGNVTFGPTRPMIVLDSNPPRTTHWLYEDFETGKTPEGWRMFTQPPAVYKDNADGEWKLNPDAENLSHLPTGYYDKQLAASEDFIRVNLANEFGMSRKGKPVWNKYSEHKHVSKEKLEPLRGYPIILGLDFGLTPAGVFCQVTGQGLRVLDEAPAFDEMLEDFLTEYIDPIKASRYPGYTIVACGDPSGKQRDRHTKLSDFNILQQHGIKAFPAPTNDPVQRIAAVTWFLSRDGGFIVSPHLTHLREAMGGGYVLKEVKNQAGQYSDVPVKNEYSHISDALQYAALFARYGTNMIASKPKPAEQKPYLWA